MGAFTKAEDQLMGLEKAINPLLGDNDQMALSYILQKVLSDKIMTMAEARPFLRTLDRSENKIIQPMDLEMILSKVMAHNYQRRGILVSCQREGVSQVLRDGWDEVEEKKFKVP